MAVLKGSILPLVIVGAASLVGSGPALAIGNWGSSYSEALWDTPWQHFTDEDWKGFNATLDELLNQGKDGDTRTWNNAKTKASAEFTILKSVTRKEVLCKEVKIVAEAAGLRRVTGIAYCPDSDGQWTAIPGRNGKPF